MTNLNPISTSISLSSALLLLLPVTSYAFLSPITNLPITSRSPHHRPLPFLLQSKIDDDSWNFDADDDSFEDDEEDLLDLLESIRPGSLGIDIGKDLAFSASDTEDLKAEIAEEVNQLFEDRMEELEDIRSTVADDFEKSKEVLSAASEVRTQEAQEKLMDKIDAISNKFLSETKGVRDSTKMAAKADRGMQGRGLDLGSWGEIGGNAVTIGGASGEDSSDDDEIMNPDEKGNKILVISDDKQDPATQKIVQKLIPLLSAYSIETKIESSSKPAPIGGFNSPTAIISASCLSERSSMNTILDRLLRRTAPIPGKPMPSPPSHILLLSSLGTERTDKMPYSMQNLFGGKLEKQRNIEEALITFLKTRGGNRPVDYTIVKIGNVAEKAKEKTRIAPGDSLNGDISADAAAQLVLQAIAMQPFARNATLSAVGTGELNQQEWNDLFLRLDGPELTRIEVPSDARGPLEEYLGEWAQAMFVDKTRGTTGLTTPVSVDVRTKGSVKILFKATNTGGNYQSFSEERELEKERRSGDSKSPNKSEDSGERRVPIQKARKNGGVEVLVEDGIDGGLRVRAKRSNMDDKTVVKEMSEEVIIKRLQEAVNVWLK